MNPIETREQVLAELHRGMTEMEALASDLIQNPPADPPMVIRTSPSVYLRLDGDKCNGSGVMRCTRFSVEEARTLAPTVRDGKGNVGQVVALVDALYAERNAIGELYCELEGAGFERG